MSKSSDNNHGSTKNSRIIRVRDVSFQHIDKKQIFYFVYISYQFITIEKTMISIDMFQR